MNFIIQLLNENYYLLVPALWAIGYALQQTPHVPDWSIIWILFLISLTLATFAFGFHYEAIVNSITATGVTILGQELIEIRGKPPPDDNDNSE